VDAHGAHLSAILARYPRLTTFASTFIFFFISLLIVCAFLFTAIRSDSSSQHPPSGSGTVSSDSEDGHDSAGRHPDEKRYSRRQIFKRDSGSDSSAPVDEKPYPQGGPSLSGSGVQMSALRKRRSSQIIASQDAGGRRNQVKIEVDVRMPLRVILATD
jgi:hypothetical protein